MIIRKSKKEPSFCKCVTSKIALKLKRQKPSNRFALKRTLAEFLSGKKMLELLLTLK
tara:strand:- start:203 stop:373 length:171 start_codon:yes stop_codon:yes gene_type:complete